MGMAAVIVGGRERDARRRARAARGGAAAAGERRSGLPPARGEQLAAARRTPRRQPSRAPADLDAGGPGRLPEARGRLAAGACAAVIAGVLARGSGATTDPARALGGERVRAVAPGALGSRGASPARAHEADGLLVVLDGFLLGPIRRPGAGRRPAWRSSGTGVARAPARRLHGRHLGRGRAGGARGVRPVLAASLPDARAPGTAAAVLDAPAGASETAAAAIRRPTPGVIAPWIAPHYLQGHRTMMDGVERVGARAPARAGRGRVAPPALLAARVARHDRRLVGRARRDAARRSCGERSPTA